MLAPCDAFYFANAMNSSVSGSAPSAALCAARSAEASRGVFAAPTGMHFGVAGSAKMGSPGANEAAAKS